MILIADSGSTKTDWVMISDGNKTGETITKGFNPLFTDRDYIRKEISGNTELTLIAKEVRIVHYFGAGCSSDDRKAIVHSALKDIFTNAQCNVDHDMMGCAIALCQGKPGIANILGTGSNSCYFDGNRNLVSNHGLGHILGDEASGSYFGKKLLAYYLYELMPSELRTAFESEYHPTKEEVLRHVYKEPLANVYLASHARFLSSHIDHPFIRTLLHKGMTEFVETNVMSYRESATVPVHFVGSIAWHFRNVILQVLEEKGLNPGIIIQKPITGLTDYFIKA